MSEKHKLNFFSPLFKSKHPFHSPKVLSAALSVADHEAIGYILEKSKYGIQQLLRKYGIDPAKYRDFQHDALIIFIDKIQNNQYDEQLSAPTTYLISICKYLILNYLRSKKEIVLEPLDQEGVLSQAENDHYTERKEMLEILDDILEQLGPPCSDLIRLKYLEGYRDEEIIRQKLTHFSSADSLRNSRSQCMKKLLVLANARMNKK